MSELSSYGLHPALLDPFSGRLATGVTERYFYSLAALALISPGFPLFVFSPLFGFSLRSVRIPNDPESSFRIL